MRTSTTPLAADLRKRIPRLSRHLVHLSTSVATGCLLVTSPALAENVGGIITNDTVWTLANSPYIVTNNLAITNAVTLTLEPGVSVQFKDGLGMTIRGRLLAEGNPTNRIRFTRHTGAASWSRLDFRTSTLASRLRFVDIAYAAGSGNVRGNNATLYLESVVWTNATTQLLDLTSSSITLLDSVLPNISGAEMVHGSGLPANGHAIFRGNVFGTTTGFNDIIDFTGGQRPGGILQLYDNVFLGATDDVLDLDGTDAHIEGNIFMNVHAEPGLSAPDTGSAISGGRDSTRTSRVTIARNLFYDCDRGILCKEGNFYVVQNNTFVNMLVAAVNFNEPLRSGVTAGAGVIFEDNIVWHTPTNFENVYVADPVNGTTSLRVNRNIFSAWDHTNGVGNQITDPLLVGTNGVTAENIRMWFALQTNSPARGAGANGLDLGGLVPEGASVSGEPASLTTNNWASLNVAGPGVTAYQWRLNTGAWSAPVTLTNGFAYTTNLFTNAVPLTLANLDAGSYTISLLGINSAGMVQDTNLPTLSKTWTVLGTNLDVSGLLTSNTTWAATVPIHVTNTVTVPTNVTLTIEAGALVRLATNASLNAQSGGRIEAVGTRDQPVLFRPLNGAAWGRVDATGTNASLMLRHADIQSGRATIFNGASGDIEFSTFRDFNSGTPILESDRAAHLTVRACHFTNFFETQFGRGIIVIEDCLFEGVTGDAVDMNTAAPGTVIRRSTFRHGVVANVDAVDLGINSTGVQIEQCLIYNFPQDKGVSIGEHSTNITVSGCLIFGVDIGVAVKDSSEAVIVQNTIADSRLGLSLYEKTSGQGGGHAIAWNNILWACTNSIALLNGSTLAITYSDIGGTNAYPGAGNLNTNPLFLNSSSRDYRLVATSPAVGVGTNGTTLGALFPVGSFLVDSDADGLPDTWEQTYRLDFNSPADAASDSDLDGLSNRAEFWAGTDPTSATSRLELHASPSTVGETLVLNFNAISNRTYVIEQRTTLESGNWTNRWEIPSVETNRLIQITNTSPANDASFYRLLAIP